MEIKKEFLEPGDISKDWSLAISKGIVWKEEKVNKDVENVLIYQTVSIEFQKK